MSEKSRPFLLKTGSTTYKAPRLKFANGTLTFAAGEAVYTAPAGGGGGAPTDATYLTLTSDATLTQERTLSLSAPLSGSDGGAGSAYTVSLSGWSGTTDGDLLYRNGTAVGTKSPAQARTWLDIATYYQAADAGLTSLTAADASAGLPYVSAANTWVSATYSGMLSVVSSAWKVVGLRESGGTDLAMGAVADGTVLRRSGTSIVGAAIGSVLQAWASILDAIAALSSTGLIARIGAGMVAARSIEVGPGLTVSNGDGASGNPSITLDDMIKSVRAFNYFTIVLPQGPTNPNVDGMGLLTAGGVWNSHVSEANFPAFQLGDGGSALCRWYVLAYFRTNAGTYSITFWWKMTADIGSVGVVTVFMGLSSVVSLNSADPTGHRVCLRYVSGTDTNWQLSTKDGATQSLVDTGVAVTASYYYAAQFTVTSSSASVKIGRDTTAAGAITAMIADTPINASGNLPGSTENLYLIQSINRSSIGTARGLISGGAWQSLTP